MTQDQYNQSHAEALQAISHYLSGLTMLHELKTALLEIETPEPNKEYTNLIDPATGLRF